MMISGNRLTEVAVEQVGDITERYPDYRADLVKRLVEVLRKQSESTGQRARRRDVGEIVGAFSQQVQIKIAEEGK